MVVERNFMEIPSREGGKEEGEVGVVAQLALAGPLFWRNSAPVTGACRLREATLVERLGLAEHLFGVGRPSALAAVMRGLLQQFLQFLGVVAAVALRPVAQGLILLRQGTISSCGAGGGVGAGIGAASGDHLICGAAVRYSTPEDTPDNEPPQWRSSLRSPELMNADDTLLVVVDLQERLLPVIPTQHTVQWNVGRLATGARILSVPVVATEQYPEKLGSTIESVADQLSRPALPKLAFSCTACGELFEGLLEQGIHRLLLCGIETHVCVLQSAYDLMSRGFMVYVAVDAVGARHEVDHQTALRRLESAGAVLTTTEMALFEWCREAGTAAFKQISQLVKQPMPVQPTGN